MTAVELVEPELPAFSRVVAKEVPSQLKALLDDHRREIVAITAQMGSSWAAVAQPMDNLNDRLNKFWSPISHLNAVLNSESLRVAYNTSIPELSRYGTELGQNQALFNAYQRLLAAPEFKQLTEAQQKSVSNNVRDFRLAGVNLSGEHKIRYQQIAQRLAELSSQFNDNVLDATNAWSKHFADAASLAGLPDSALALAQQNAKTRQKEGYLLTLDFPCYHAVMTFAQERELRREMYTAYSTRASEQGPDSGKFDNSAIMLEILSLRLEKARLLGFENYAELSLATKMAESTEQVLQFLNDLASKSVTAAREEFQRLQQFAAQQGLAELAAWDVSFYAEKLKTELFAVSQEDLKPYFPLDKVIEGLFVIIGRLFGVTFQEVNNVDRYHPDMRFVKVQRDGISIASIYMDLFARQNKRGGAWMADYAVRRKLDDGRVQQPVAFVVGNFTPATEALPALLTHNEVTTLFHEFGHALHHVLTQVDCSDVSGINGVAWDAVELPSQFLENWCWEPEALKVISGHYQSGEPLPQEMLTNMLAAKNFQSAMVMVRQLEFALFDWRLHSEFTGQPGVSVQSLLDEVRDAVAVIRPPVFNRFQHSFSHIFAGGYGAGYYSYKWAEVLSADAFSKFEENGIFDERTGREFLQTILEKGGSREPMELFTEFRGRPPQVDALLRHSGIAS